VAGRIEHYNTFGSSSNPKIGVRYAPLNQLTLLGTWGRSFKAPTLYQQSSPTNSFLYDASVLGAKSEGTALFDYGGNRALQPERATSWTTGVEWSPPSRRSLDISATYFNIDYKDRVVLPITVATQGLSDPAYASYVIRNPTAAQIEQVIANTERFLNVASAPYDPSQVVAILEDRYTNASSQTIHGVDFSLKDSIATPNGSVAPFLNATWLHVAQQTNPTLPPIVLTGTLFNSPKLRVRSGATWTYGGFATTGVINYISSETDTGVSPTVPIASWTVVDLNLSYRFPTGGGVWSGIEAALSASNLLNRDPPYARGAGLQSYGLVYDSANASPVGRFLALTLRKRL